MRKIPPGTCFFGLLTNVLAKHALVRPKGDIRPTKEPLAPGSRATSEPDSYAAVLGSDLDLTRKVTQPFRRASKTHAMKAASASFRAGMPITRLIKHISGTRWLRLAAGVSLAVVAVLSLIPGQLQQRTSLPPSIEHLVAYLGTALLLGLAWPRPRRLSFFFAVFLVAYAALLEILQNLIVGRTANLSGALVSSTGALIGLAAAARGGPTS